MQTKLFELRDRCTFIPIMVTQIQYREIDHNLSEKFLLDRAGLDTEVPYYLLTSFTKEVSRLDAYDWGDRTYKTAHLYIAEHFDMLESGEVIDIEYILGETSCPKTTERLI